MLVWIWIRGQIQDFIFPLCNLLRFISHRTIHESWWKTSGTFRELISISVSNLVELDHWSLWAEPDSFNRIYDIYRRPPHLSRCGSFQGPSLTRTSQENTTLRPRETQGSSVVMSVWEGYRHRLSPKRGKAPSQAKKPWQNTFSIGLIQELAWNSQEGGVSFILVTLFLRRKTCCDVSMWRVTASVMCNQQIQGK